MESKEENKVEQQDQGLKRYSCRQCRKVLFDESVIEEHSSKVK